MTCRRCGISRPTLRRWVQRFQLHGLEGLESKSSRPKSSPRRKVDDRVRGAILELRATKNIGARRIQIELGLIAGTWLSRTTIQKTLDRADVKRLRRPKRTADPKRYSRPIPGDRLQLDTMKLARGVYQYTAIDDCTRFRVLGLYPRRAAQYTVHFLERVVEEMPFPIQRAQTDRGTEFLAERVQKWLKENFIKLRPTPPRSPHLNGKVERSQKTDLQEFWANRGPPKLDDSSDLECWQFDYNWRRPHGSLGGKTPAERVAELIDVTPLHEDIADAYEPDKEPLSFSNSKADLAAKIARDLNDARKRFNRRIGEKAV